jgi:hypothetical protein
MKAVFLKCKGSAGCLSRRVGTKKPRRDLSEARLWEQVDAGYRRFFQKNHRELPRAVF